MKASEFRLIGRRADSVGATNEVKLLHLILGWLQSDASVADEAGDLRRFIANEISSMEAEQKEAL